MPPLELVNAFAVPVCLAGLLLKAPVPLGSSSAPNSPGFYALLYQGPHPLYREISGRCAPIYVGSAERLGARLSDHARSIEAVSNLFIEHFSATAVATATSVDAHVAEIVLQRALQPIWCSAAAKGFGSRRQGRRRESAQLATPWDTIHPGRAWAGGMGGRDPAAVAADTLRSLQQTMSEFALAHRTVER